MDFTSIGRFLTKSCGPSDNYLADNLTVAMVNTGANPATSKFYNYNASAVAG
jgi:hypothetical protein